MIAFYNNLPLVQDSEGIATVFETRWLQESIARAAERAGYEQWWLTGDLVESITFYLANCYAKNVIPEPQLERAVRLALHEIGYGEIARCFGSEGNSQQMSLLRCLPRESPDGLAEFFERLAKVIENLHRAKTSQFHFCDLQSCVRSLQDFSCAGPSTVKPALRDCIVLFVRQKIEALTWRHNMHFSIS